MKIQKHSNFFYSLQAAMVLCLIASSTAYAHFPWITLLEGGAAEQKTVDFELSWGHHFPTDGKLAADRIASIQLIKPDSSIHDLAIKNDPVYSIDSQGISGTYIIAATQKSSYYSRTTRGGQRGSRVDFPDALSCGFSFNTMKAVFSEKGYEGDAGHILGHPLEIIPMADPGELSKGDVLPIKVRFHGKPFKGTISATWEGFSDEGNFALEEQTSNEGTVELPMKSEGLWLLMVHAAEDYPDNKVCDLLNYTATLTFRIK